MKSFAAMVFGQGRVIGFLILFLIMGGISKSAHADVTFTYSGPSFSIPECEAEIDFDPTLSFPDPCTGGSLTGSVTIPDALVTAGGEIDAGQFTSWTFTGPFGTLSSNSNYILGSIDLSGGVPTDWFILAHTDPLGSSTGGVIFTNGPNGTDLAGVYGGPYGYTSIGLVVPTQPGTWTTTTDGGCQINVMAQSQANSPWSQQIYDHASPETIQAGGCALTALSMALNTAGQTTDPGALNTLMTATAGDYKGTSVNWGAATRDASGEKLKFHDSYINSATDMQAATQYLDSTLCQENHPVIVGVNLDTNGNPGHFVLVTGKEGNNYSIIDPGHNNKTTLSQYQNQFVTRGYVADPPGDISELDVATGDFVEFLVSNPSGQKSGYDPSSQQEVRQLSNSSYFGDSLINDVTGAPPTEVDYSLEISTPPQGSYQVLVSGLKLGIYSLTVSVYSQDGSKQPVTTVTGIAGPGSASLFSIQLNTTPGATSAVTAMVTFQSTLEDINNSLRLGLIDNQGIANSLSQKIQVAQDSAARANILNAFVNEVNAQGNKHITGAAVEILVRDATSLLSQRL